MTIVYVIVAALLGGATAAMLLRSKVEKLSDEAKAELVAEIKALHAREEAQVVAAKKELDKVGNEASYLRTSVKKAVARKPKSKAKAKR